MNKKLPIVQIVDNKVIEGKIVGEKK